MITKQTTANEADYIALFAEAEAAIGEKINSIQTYFAHITELANKDKKFLRLPLDEPMFEIDADSRKIDVSKFTDIQVQGDHLAEMIFFSVDRYFDAMDLNNVDIFVNWKMGSVSGKTKIFMKNTSIKPDYIVFGWPISEDVTAKSGSLSFAVEFSKSDADGNIQYALNTQVATLNIRDGLVLTDPTIIDVTDDIFAMLTNSSFGTGDAAVDDAIFFVLPESPVNLNSTLDDDDAPISVAKNILFAAKAGQGAEVVYTNLDGTTVAEEFVAIDPALTELDSTITYYENTGSEAIPAYSPISSADFLAFKDAEEKPIYYYKEAAVTVEKAGSYAIKAQGVKFDSDGNKIGAGNAITSTTITVPAAEVPSLITTVVDGRDEELPEGYEINAIEAKDVAFIIDGLDMPSVKVTASESADGLFKYEWTKGGEVIEGAKYVQDTSASLVDEDEAEATVSCEVTHFKNATTAGPVTSTPIKFSKLATKIAVDKFELDQNMVQLTMRTGAGAVQPSQEISCTFKYENTPNVNEEVTAKLLCRLADGDAESIADSKPECIVNDVNKTVSCTLRANQLSDGEGQYVIAISNSYNGSIYTVKTDPFYINITTA